MRSKHTLVWKCFWRPEDDGRSVPRSSPVLLRQALSLTGCWDDLQEAPGMILSPPPERWDY